MSNLPPASSIIDGALYQGDFRSVGTFRKRPDLHVACPAEIPPDSKGAKRVLFFPLHDNSMVRWHKNPLWCRQVSKVACLVADGVASGDVVLVTCAAGLNRSGLVNALALCALGWPPKAAIKMIRTKRRGSLFNRRFVTAIRELGPTLRV